AIFFLGIFLEASRISIEMIFPSFVKSTIIPSLTSSLTSYLPSFHTTRKTDKLIRKAKLR
ncbi:MAG: hypothetical protein U9P44_03470, partial [archaeon]|nr:hypothetical protein [archaeon]